MVLFKPTYIQVCLLSNFTDKNLILKKRQRGISTLILVYIFDLCFTQYEHSALVMVPDEYVKSRVFRGIVKVMFDNLPELFKKGVKVTDNSIRFPNGSSLTVCTRFRSGAATLLYVMEYPEHILKYGYDELIGITGTVDANGGQVFMDTTEITTSLHLDVFSDFSVVDIKGSIEDFVA